MLRMWAVVPAAEKTNALVQIETTIDVSDTLMPSYRALHVQLESYISLQYPSWSAAKALHLIVTHKILTSLIFPFTQFLPTQAGAIIGTSALV